MIILIAIINSYYSNLKLPNISQLSRLKCGIQLSMMHNTSQNVCVMAGCVKPLKCLKSTALQEILHLSAAMK